MILLILTDLGYNPRSVQQSSAQNSFVQKKSSPFNPVIPIAVDSIIGYTVRINEDHIEISKDTNSIVDAIVYSIDKYYLHRAKELDSVDTVRGFALARALTGPAIGEADNCYNEYTIDSLVEFKNRFNLRCFRIFMKGKTTCDDNSFSPSYYQGYLVSLSDSTNIELVQIPSGLDFLDVKSVTEMSRLLANSIRSER
jgi:hypothetical protein